MGKIGKKSLVDPKTGYGTNWVKNKVKGNLKDLFCCKNQKKRVKTQNVQGQNWTNMDKMA